MALNTGMEITLKELVTEDKLAVSLGSGSLRVYGTPAMLRLIEATAVALLDGKLEEGQTSVGTNLNVDHVAATPVGCEVTSRVILEDIDGRKLTFTVEVRDPAGVIGRGTHERFLVDSERFQKKADAKNQ